MTTQIMSLQAKTAVVKEHLKAPNSSFIYFTNGRLEVTVLDKVDSPLYTRIFIKGSDIRCLKEQAKDIQQLFQPPSSYDSGVIDSEGSDSEGSDSEKYGVYEANCDLKGYEVVSDHDVKGFKALTLSSKQVRKGLFQVEGSDPQTIKDALSAIESFAVSKTQESFNTLTCNLKNLPDEVKQYIFDNGLFEKVLGSRCIFSCNDKLPLFILEAALNPQPKEFDTFLTKLVNHESRNSCIDALKYIIDMDKQSQNLILDDDKKDIEKQLGFALPAMTYNTLYQVLCYIEYATNEGLVERLKHLVGKAGGLEVLKIQQTEQAERLCQVFKGSFKQVFQAPNLLEAKSFDEYVRKLDKGIRKDITEEARSHYPISFSDKSPVRCLDTKGDVAQLRAHIHEFANSLGLQLDEEKQKELERVVLFYCTQASFPPLVNYLISNYKQYWKSSVESEQAAAIDFKYEGDKSITFAPLENGFRVHVSVDYLHQVSLEDESLSCETFVTKQDLQKARKSLNIGAFVKTVAQGSFDIIIDPEKIKDPGEYQMAFQMKNFNANHEYPGLVR